MSDLDDLGAPVPLAGAPTRVVSLVPSLTEAVETTAPGLLVGATDYCTHPPTLDVPRVGGSKYPTVAAVLDQRPDLVIANAEENRPEDVSALRAAGVPVWVTAAPATVMAGIDSTRRLLVEALRLTEPAWLTEAAELWADTTEVWATAVVPVWRKPWIVLGRDTFAGDVLLRLGVANAYADHPERYPRPPLSELQATRADLVVLPDEPYEFTADDGPQFFPEKRPVLVVGRYLTWYGPSLVDARRELAAALNG
ncbi:helical backbone metal receptor [Actinokineospora sp. UTMC 2448]|uniref:helical backbone metal receptor n=1 Tax=Actinokineospora sp. UTMC 2448 TaxID=2268449 RepID=UPI002164E0DD|nr:helical backbone metal receptor [Actinokineospora sp. UTMC 2448]UVS77245.1 putative ABC transporter PGF-CTERM-modified substrate-binding protein [Actinokineospora sp. UTMC 2448]